MKLFYLLICISLVFVQGQVLIHEYEHHHDEEHQCDFWLYSQAVEKQSYFGSYYIASILTYKFDWKQSLNYFVYSYRNQILRARAPPTSIS